MKKKIFVVALAAAMALSSAISAFAAQHDSTYYFSFDGTVDDATPVAKGNNGTTGNATEKDAWTFADGAVGGGQSLNVNAEGDNIGLDTGIVIGSKSYTIAFYAKAYSVGFAAPLIWIGDDQGSGEAWHGVWSGLSSEWNSTRAGYGSNDAAGTRPQIGGNPFNEATASTFEWTYVTVTFDATTGEAKLYIDGELTGTANNDGTAAEGAETGVYTFPALREEARLYVGANWWDAPANYLIDELEVWEDKVLTADEVKALYVEPAQLTDEERESISASVEESVSESIQQIKDRNEANKNNAGTVASTEKEEGNPSVLPIVIVVVVVVVVIVVVGIVLASKKKKK